MEVLKLASRSAPSVAPERLYVLHRPMSGPVIALVVYAPPLAEEMNKSRRMAAQQARMFAANGVATLLVDPLGCGDSDGDLADATWHAWVDDLVDACQWLRERTGAPGAPLWLWGLRSGCLISVGAGSRIAGDCRHLLWQPVQSGRQCLQQFLRLKTAGGLADGRAAASTAELLRQLADGAALDVAGYRLSSVLADGLGAATLEPPARPTQALMLEVQPQPGSSPSPGLLALESRWSGAGHVVAVTAVAGPSFWQTSEVEDAPELVALTTRLVVAASRETAAAR
ncbi:MAG: hydrolase 2, exosortase A system-associated [Rubrivivax sp.]